MAPRAGPEWQGKASLPCMPRVSFPRAQTAFGLALALHVSIVWLTSRIDANVANAEHPAPLALQVALLDAITSEAPRAASQAPDPRVGDPLGDETPAGAAPGKASRAAVQPPQPAPKAPRKLAESAPPPDTLPPKDTLSLDDTARPPSDWFAFDKKLAAKDSLSNTVRRTRPAAARTRSLRHASGRPSGSGALGASTSEGGFGGRGRGTAGSGSGAGSFGGSSGHFKGQVCFIEPGTKALRQLGACQVQGEFFTDVFNVTPRSFTSGFPGVSDRSEWFAILYTGILITLEPGTYVFRVVSDDGSILRIDGEVVVDNDGQHGPVSSSGRMFLSRGSHQLELRYFQGPRTMVALQVFVTPPDGEEQLLRGTL